MSAVYPADRFSVRRLLREHATTDHATQVQIERAAMGAMTGHSASHALRVGLRLQRQCKRTDTPTTPRPAA